MEFTDDYQEELILKAATKGFLERAAPLLRTDMFNLQLQPIIEEVLKRYRKNKKAILTKRQLEQLCHRNKIKLQGTVQGDWSFDVEELSLFKRNRILRSAIVRMNTLCEAGKFDAAFKAASDAQKESIGPGKNVPDIIRSTTAIPKRINLIPTGITILDEKLKGGVGGTDLATVMAPTSGGKTSFLVWVTCLALRMGKRVSYTTFEGPAEEIEAKVKRCLTNKAEPSRVVWKKVALQLQRKKAECRVHAYGPRAISAYELDAEILNNVDLIIIDYADYLRPADGSMGIEYHDLGRIYESLKRISMDRKIPVWTASQVNRGAYNRIADTQDVAESLKKVQVADIVVTIGQTEEQRIPDKDTGHSRAELHLAKNRHGERFGRDAEVTIDFATSRIVKGFWV